MSKNIEGDIYGMLEYMPINLFSNKLSVGIIGGGRGAFIKAKTLQANGAKVEALSLEFINEFSELEIKCIKGSYDKKFILDKHLIIIAINDSAVINKIIEDCNKQYKIYINSSNVKKGMAAIPVKRESKSISISVNTKLSNPKGAMMIADYLADEINKYDIFIEYTSNIRNKLEIDKKLKLEILSFINTEDFKYIFDKGKADGVLKMFYPKIIFK